MVLESYQSKGLPLIPDLLTTGESPHACGHAIRSIFQGVRSTAADYITKSNRRGNVTIKTNTIVDHVVIERDGERKRAIGAQLQSVTGEKTCYGHEGRIRRTYYGRPDQIGLTNLVPSSMGEGAWEVGLAQKNQPTYTSHSLHLHFASRP